jgi:hypothetical protein
MTAGVTRVLVALAGSTAVFAFWCLFIVAIMTMTLYICRFIPLTGKWRRRNLRLQNLGKELHR